MKLFKRPAKIKKGHSFIDYSNRFGKDYVNLKLSVESNVKNLKENKTYWEIDGKYYEVNHSHLLKIILCSLGALSLAANVFVPIYFTIIAPKDRYQDYSFQYWNNSISLNVLKDYVKEATTPSNINYVPKEDRIATFDMDGTLFGERSEIYIEWMYFNDYLSRHPDKKKDTITYAEAIKGKEGEGKVSHEISMEQVAANITSFMETRVAPEEATEGDVTYKIDLEMREANAGAFLFSGLTLEEYVADFETFIVKDAHSFNNLKFKDMFYKPMIEVVEYLQLNNFDVYIVSGTDRFMVRDVVSWHLDIPKNKVIGMDVGLDWDAERKTVVRNGTLKYKNVKSVKVELITQEIAKRPVLSFGNSSGDIQMHNCALNNANYKAAAFMVLADDNEREFGYDDITINERKKQWNSFGYNIFSMKDDFKTIYGDNVTKK